MSDEEKEYIRPQDVIEIHLVSDDEGSPTHGWIHTEGMYKFDLPELEIRGVQTFLGGSAASILNQVCGYMINKNRTVRLGETMQLGSKFCIFQFAKLDPIEGQEDHYQNERWALVEPPGAHNFCSSCGTGPLSHDDNEECFCDDPDCSCKRPQDAGGRLMVVMESRIPFLAMEAIAAWYCGDENAAFDIVLKRMAALGIVTITGETTFKLDEEYERRIMSDGEDAIIDDMLEDWEHTPHIKAIFDMEEATIDERVEKLIETFGIGPSVLRH